MNFCSSTFIIDERCSRVTSQNREQDTGDPLEYNLECKVCNDHLPGNIVGNTSRYTDDTHTQPKQPIFSNIPDLEELY